VWRIRNSPPKQFVEHGCLRLSSGEQQIQQEVIRKNADADDGYSDSEISAKGEQYFCPFNVKRWYALNIADLINGPLEAKIFHARNHRDPRVG